MSEDELTPEVVARVWATAAEQARSDRLAEREAEVKRLLAETRETLAVVGARRAELDAQLEVLLARREAVNNEIARLKLQRRKD